MFLIVIQQRTRRKEIHKMALKIPISWNNPDAKYIGKKLHMFASIATIALVMINMNVSV